MNTARTLFLILTLLLTALATLVFFRSGEVAMESAPTSPGQAPSTLTAASSLADETAGPNAEQMTQLVDAYPEHLTLDTEVKNAIIWKEDGTRMQFDDGVYGKSLEEKLAQPDLEDQMSMPYPAGEQFAITEGQDPGRVRYEAFFKKMYGANKAEVAANLVTIAWLPSFSDRPLLVTRINGVDEKLHAVSYELDRLLQQPGNEYLLPYLQDPAGTFKWRHIAGTDRLSPHSFGIAIDINSAHGEYWRWSEDAAADYQNSVPLEIVEVFEEHGFIWGGKWYHFDTMHFEYRPELLPERQ